MSDFGFEILTSTDAIRLIEDDWDLLWQRSQCMLPVAQAGLVAQWIEHFAPRSSVRTIAVYDHRRLVAVLPLIGRGPRFLQWGCLPCNEWSPAGMLLVDPEADANLACDALVSGIRRIGWPFLVLDAVLPQDDGWRELIAALKRNKLSTALRERCRVNQVEIDGDWQTYLASRSKNHRRQIRRAASRIENSGETRLRIFDQIPPSDVAEWLARGFAIEDRSWKAAEGTSVLRSSRVFDFYVTQAQKLAQRGQLRIAFLEYRGELIAFEYGWAAKGIYFTPKVGYDASYRQLGPSQVLRAALIEQMFGDPHWQLLDFCGPACRATSEWKTRDYPVGRLVVATNLLGRSLLRTYKMLAPVTRRLRDEHRKPVTQTPATIDASRTAGSLVG